jgi:membrane-associated phospholipid phosphatase
MHSIRAVALVLGLVGAWNSTIWAQEAGQPAQNPPAAGAPASPAAQQTESDEHTAVPSEAVNHAKRIDDDRKDELKPGADPDNHLLLPFLKHLASDQKAFWIAPALFQKKDIEWIVPFAGVTAGFLAGDSWISKQIPLGDAQRSQKISNYGVYSLIGAGAGSFLLGHLKGDDQMSEAGLLSGEAAINSTAVAYLLKSATQRPRPFQDNGNGTFFQGGSSFPSEHSAIAWSVASVLAHEYPGTLTKILAYGLATGVSATRVTGQQHFASDVIIGGTLGWYFGRQVYRTHHDRDLGGAGWGDLLPDHSEMQTRNPANMGSPYVPVDSWVYPLFDRLAATGYVNTAYMGLRPWTRMECARLLEEASDRIQIDMESGDDLQRMYRALATEFADEASRLDGASNVGASLDSVYTRFTGISGPPLRDGYHFAQTIINDYGRPYGEGFNNVTGLTAYAVAGPFSFSIQGEYQHAPTVASDPPGVLQAIAAADATLSLANGTAAINRLRLLESAVSFTVRNVQFSFGKQSFWLGPGQAGPFLFSDNAEPIPMFRIDQVSPLYVPLLSRVLGPMRTEFALGRLSGQTWAFASQQLFGPHLNNQPFIHVDKISFKPTANFEFGMGVSVIFGGPDLPFTWKNFLRTYSSNGVPGTRSDSGDRRSTFEFSYRVPWLRNRLTIYADSLVEDEVSPLGSTRPSMRIGIYIPRVPKVSKLDLRAEGLYTDVPGQKVRGFIYWNGRFLSGYTNDGDLLASWVGRQGKGGQGWATYWFSGRSNLQFSFRRQVVDRVFIGGGQLNAAAANCEIELPRGIGISAGVQYEQWEFPVLQPNRNSDTSARFQITFNPHLRIEKSN